ncbi:MAG: hypothetical protein GW772_01295 [Flavobacteriia bacterium]|nr:hypothetical protein [Flavobacteriia bacterium]
MSLKLQSIYFEPPFKTKIISFVSLDDFYFEKVELTDKAIIEFIEASGKMKIFIDGME